MEGKGRYLSATLGAVNSVNNPYGRLDLRHYRLKKVDKLSSSLMNDHLDMGFLTAKAMSGFGNELAFESDTHTRIAAKQLDGDKRSYVDLYNESEREILDSKHSA